ncbi:MAG: lipoyl synthase [Opitutales bacterium]|nr:lipoyl synthase [Opitutales bacterium]
MQISRKPDWLRQSLATSNDYHQTRDIVEGGMLHTVCESARCPNRGECWSSGTATLMILGNICTRRCTFCNIESGRPGPVDIGEPARAADAVKRMGLKYVVITSVSRDDLKDGGAEVWASTIRAVRNKNPEAKVEVLVPDFRGNTEHLDMVLDAGPDVLNHNIETVARLQKPIRKTASREVTLSVLKHAKSRGFVTKSGLMLGIGETSGEIEAILHDLREADVDILTIGQYLQPTAKHEKVDRWVSPDEFEYWKEVALRLEFKAVESGPLVRSSYRAAQSAQTVFALRNSQSA